MVLEPFRERLGSLDGAAILARIDAEQGKYDQADKLLSTYLEARIPMLRAAERSYASITSAVHERIFVMVDKGRATHFDYKKYNSVSQAERDILFTEYLNAWLRWEPAVRAANKERLAQARVVPAAIQLGIVRLYRAQKLADPQQRRKERERAEEAFRFVDDPIVRAELIGTHANRALQDGRDEEAGELLRQTLSIYDKLPEDAVALNNGERFHFDLYGLTHEREQFQRWFDKLERAIALQPSNRIVLGNAAPRMAAVAVRDLIGSAIDLKVLKRFPGIDLLPHLYADQASMEGFIARLRVDPYCVKARAYAEKLTVLAPREAGSYRLLERLYSWTRDLEGLRGLWRKLKTVEVDRASRPGGPGLFRRPRRRKGPCRVEEEHPPPGSHPGGGEQAQGSDSGRGSRQPGKHAHGWCCTGPGGGRRCRGQAGRGGRRRRAFVSDEILPDPGAVVPGA